LPCEVRYIDQTKGRGVFANRDIQAGETVISEFPAISALINVHDKDWQHRVR
jgi:hypothetical protein